MQYLLTILLSITIPVQETAGTSDTPDPRTVENSSSAESSRPDSTHVVIVQGTPGTDAYQATFGQWTDRVEEAAVEAGAKVTRIGRNDDTELSDRDRLKQTLAKSKSETTSSLWLVMIGHGTFTGKTAKFNLRGRDVTSDELNNWLESVPGTLAIVNCSSSSAPFINKLAGPNRIVVTSTKSGAELNYSRFGDYFSQAISDPAADLDKDEQTSLLEAFLYASKGVKEFYDKESRLMTEHAIIDDNGDGKGTPSDWFRGVRVTKTSKDQTVPDGLRANQLHLAPSLWERMLPAETRKLRDAIEFEIERLRLNKASLREEEYYQQLEKLMIPLSELYEGADDGKKTESDQKDNTGK